MPRLRRLSQIFWLGAIAGGCSLVADFKHLDDGKGGRGGRDAGPAASGGASAASSSSSSGTGGAGGGGGEGGSGGRACKTAIALCMSAEECCGDLQCLMTSAGLVCCGLTGEPCKTRGGEDCCVMR